MTFDLKYWENWQLFGNHCQNEVTAREEENNFAITGYWGWQCETVWFTVVLVLQILGQSEFWNPKLIPIQKTGLPYLQNFAKLWWKYSQNWSTEPLFENYYFWKKSLFLVKTGWFRAADVRRLISGSRFRAANFRPILTIYGQCVYGIYDINQVFVFSHTYILSMWKHKNLIISSF